MIMKKNQVKSILYTIVFGFSFLFFADPTICKATSHPSTDKDEKTLAEDFFKDENYLKALPLYVHLYEENPKKTIYAFRAGICYLYKGDEKQKSIEYFEKILKDAPKTEDLYLYLGRAYHLNERFDDALTYLQKYLDQKPSQEKKQMAELLIDNCKNAKEMVQTPLIVNIQNLGPSVNTKNSEYGPVISSDESVLIYTYRGERSTGGLMDYDGNPSIFGDYYEDIFISYKVGGNWLTPESIGDHINTKGHDAAIALSDDGQQLFIFKSTPEDGGDIYISKLEGDIWSMPEKLKGDINTKYWEGSCSLSSDGKTLYFASERPGGLGKRDIYVAKLQANGSWGDVKNLGPAINTKYNDDAPFIHPDGKMLHFSSEGHKSIGRSDIFRAELMPDGSWSDPVNLGYPINSTEDDRYYVLSADGKRGYYSSGKAGGYGDQDIYVVDPGFAARKIALAMITGAVTLDDKPTKADIKVSDVTNKKDIGNYSSNTSTGKYLINLPTGINYDLTYKVEGVDEQKRNLNTASVDSFMNASISVKFYTKEFAEKLKQDSIAKAKAVVPTMNNDSTLSYDDIVKKYGSYTMDDLAFRVQIAAYEMAQNFQTGPVSKLGKIEKQKYQDGITRFTIGGEFKTLNEADNLKKAVRAAGVTDAFVLCFYKGQRISIKSLFASLK